MLGTPKIIKDTGKHVRPKRAVMPENGTIFDFMLCPNNKAPVIDTGSPILDTLKSNINNSYPSAPGLNIENSFIPILKLIRICNNTIDSSETELELVKELLEHANISGYEVSYPTEKLS